MPGHAATSIDGDGTTAYVTTGDDGGSVTIDVKSPAAPAVTQFVSLPHAVNVVRNYQRTYVLGGSPGAVYTTNDGGELVPFADNVASGPLSAPSRMAVWNNQLYTNAASGSFVQIPLDGTGKRQLASIEGTANGIDVGGGGIAVLAQGEVGTAVDHVDRDQRHSARLVCLPRRERQRERSAIRRRRWQRVHLPEQRTDRVPHHSDERHRRRSVVVHDGLVELARRGELVVTPGSGDRRNHLG